MCNLNYNKKKKSKIREFASGDHWYLQTLGVKPAHQGKGYGSLLMEYILEKIDKTNPLPVFLETSTEINVKFYKRSHLR